MIRLVVNPLRPFEKFEPFDEGMLIPLANRTKKVAIVIIQIGNILTIQLAKKTFHVVVHLLLRGGIGFILAFSGMLIIGSTNILITGIITTALEGCLKPILLISARVIISAISIFMSFKIDDWSNRTDIFHQENFMPLEILNDDLKYGLGFASYFLMLSSFSFGLFFDLFGIFVPCMWVAKISGLLAAAVEVPLNILKTIYFTINEIIEIFTKNKRTFTFDKDFCKSVLINYLSNIHFDQAIGETEITSIKKEIIEQFAISTPKAIGDFPRLIIEQLMRCDRVNHNNTPYFLYHQMNDIRDLQNQYRALPKLSPEMDRNLRNFAGRMASRRGLEMSWCHDMSSSANELLTEL